jgi:hypothetical protein
VIAEIISQPSRLGLQTSKVNSWHFWWKETIEIK